MRSFAPAAYCAFHGHGLSLLGKQRPISCGFSARAVPRKGRIFPQPGYIESGLVNKEKLGEFYNGLVAKHPMGRIGNPDEVAHTVVFLCENDFITGTIVHVDGGYTAQ